MKSKRVLALIMGAIIASGGISQMAVQVYADDEESSSISEFEEESSVIPWEQAEAEFEWLDEELMGISNSVEEGLDAEVLKKLSYEIETVNKLVRDEILTTAELDELYVSGSDLVFKRMPNNEAEVVCYDVNKEFDGVVTVPRNVIIEGKEYTVTSIGNSAFKNYKRLENVVLPLSITKIGESAFSRCTKLKLTALPNGLKEIGNHAFYWCGSLKLTELPEGLTEIGWDAFSGCKNLQLTELPKSLIVIGRYAFFGCESLESIELPADLKEIGESAFSHCTNLKSIELPADLKEIGKDAFSVCENLKSIELPEGLTKIGEDAFAGCINLQLTELPKSLIVIGIDAFKGTNIVVAPDLIQQPKRKTIYSPDQLVGGDGTGCKCPMCYEEIIDKDNKEPVEVVELPCNEGVHCHYSHLECFEIFYSSMVAKNAKTFNCPVCRQEYAMLNNNL